MKANAGKRKIFDAVDLLTEDTSAQSTEVKVENGVAMIAIDSIKAFHNHPFHLYEGERLDDMVESIREHGVLNPVIVLKSSDGYEMLSGHNRANAARLAGLTEIPAIVKVGLSKAEAYVYVIETNLMQRSFTDLMLLLKRNADAFKTLANDTIGLASAYKNRTFENIENLLKTFYDSTYGKARAFEVVMHGLMQAKAEMDAIGDWELVPLSQMRSANKKHGNVGDIELSSDEIIVEAWDAKYGKTYLLDELDELRDKLIDNPGVEVAGFVADRDVDKTDEILDKIAEISSDTSTEIILCSFDECLLN